MISEKIQKRIETAKNLNEAESHETVQLLMTFSSLFIIFFVAPLLYYVTDGDIILVSLIFLIGIFDLVMSEYFPEKLAESDTKAFDGD